MSTQKFSPSRPRRNRMPLPSDVDYARSRAERLLYYALIGAPEAGLVRTADDR